MSEKYRDKIQKIEKEITYCWEHERYIQICDRAEEVFETAQSYIDKYGRNDFQIAKMCAYALVSIIIMGDGDLVDIIEAKKNTFCIKNIFRNKEICEWTLSALEIFNIDYSRCGFIERIIPKEYADRFDFGKFDGSIVEYNETEFQEIAEKKEIEWDEFINKCNEVGVIDLKSVKLDFQKEFFEDETRNDFYIAPFMKNAWAANLEVLHKVDILCQELDIPYFVDWGTLLGTVRHKGFIPWDDDIDIGVLRKDYNKLKYAIANCQNELEMYDIYEEADWGEHASKITNSLSFFTDRYDIKRYDGFPFPAGVDVFIIDCVPRDKALEKEQYDTLRAIVEVVQRRTEMIKYEPESDEYQYAQQTERVLVETIERMCHIEFTQKTPTNQELFILKDEILSLYSEEQSDYYTVPHRLASGQDYYIPKEVFDGRIRMPFEGIEVNVPSGYEFILKKNYGEDYMTPINRGGGHDYPFYDIFVEGMMLKRKDKTIEDTWKHVENTSFGYYRNFIHQKNEPTYKFEDSFFEKSVVDGCEITEATKKNRAAELEVLAEIKRICDKKGFKYFAIGDTIVGAEKYAGYTPQAEGIHIGMMREDYVDFMNCLGEELDSWFTHQSIYLNDEHIDMRTYVITDAFLVKDQDYLERFHGSTEIVGIDISPIDYVDDNQEKDQVRKDLINAMLRTATIVSSKPPYSEEELSLVDEWSDKVQVEIDKESNLQRSFIRAADTVAAGYRNKSQMIRITPDLQVGLDIVYPAEWFEDGIELPFENTTIIVPKGYKHMLGE